MTEAPDLHGETVARRILSGLVPTYDYSVLSEPRDTGSFSAGMLSTMPILLAGSMAVSMTLTGAVAPVSARTAAEPHAELAGSASSARTGFASARHTSIAHSVTATATVTPAPGIYTVVAGDTVNEIAERFGLSTASVLALNGLGWKSLIFPGQTLKLVAGAATPPAATPAPGSVRSVGYTIVRGDTVSHIAERFGVSVQTVLDANGLTWSSIIYPGQSLRVPVGPQEAPAPDSQSDADTSPTPEDDQAEDGATEPLPTETAVPAPAAPTPVAPTPAAPTPAPPPAATPPASTGTYVIKSGDTLSRIAASFGISVAALCAANGITTATVIYSGRTLQIPGGTSSAGAAGTVTLLTSEGEANARTIISVGRELGVSDYGIVIALATAMQESTMRNLNYGHLDSVGLFQQRPSSGWGTVTELTTPIHAARLFYGGPSNPNRGKTRGLLDIAGWQSMTVTQAAQKVQVSAYPDAYAKWESSARYWLATL